MIPFVLPLSLHSSNHQLTKIKVNLFFVAPQQQVTVALSNVHHSALGSTKVASMFLCASVTPPTNSIVHFDIICLSTGTQYRYIYVHQEVASYLHIFELLSTGKYMISTNESKTRKRRHICEIDVPWHFLKCFIHFIRIVWNPEKIVRHIRPKSVLYSALAKLCWLYYQQWTYTYIYTDTVLSAIYEKVTIRLYHWSRAWELEHVLNVLK